ncbi:MFS transporter [Haloplanus litoreus]|uniref:MFS transporter n=1 Tax=Haloplanus litoreus TaxID=767515 RepID=UPI0036D2152F
MPSSGLDRGVSTVGIVTGGHFLSHFYLLVFPPLFPSLRAQFGTTNAELGVLVAGISAAMLFQVLVGGIVDLVGAKRVFVGGVAITSLGVFLAGTSSSYLGLLAFATVSGVGQSTFHPADYPIVETVSDPDTVGRNFSLHTFGGYLGYAAAPLIVGALENVYGWRTALLIVGSVGVAYAVGAAVALRPVYRTKIDADERRSDGQAASGRDTVLRSGIVVMAAFFVFFSVAGTGVRTFAPLLAIDGFRLTDATGNTALSVFFAVTAVSVLVGGVLADRFDPRYVIAAATATVALSLLLVVGNVTAVRRLTFVASFGLSGGARPRLRLS